MKKMLECCHADTCLPDYWGGHHLAHVQISVTKGMSLKEIKSALHDELGQGVVMGSDETSNLLRADWVPPDKEQEADRVCKAAHAAVNRVEPARKGQRKFFTDIEEGEETVYAYFVFRELS